MKSAMMSEDKIPIIALIVFMIGVLLYAPAWLLMRLRVNGKVREMEEIINSIHKKYKKAGYRWDEPPFIFDNDIFKGIAFLLLFIFLTQIFFPDTKIKRVVDDMSYTEIQDINNIKEIPILRAQWSQDIKDGKYEDLKKGFTIIEEAAYLGDAASQEILCEAHIKGDIATIDYKKAFFWCNKAANNNGLLVFQLGETSDLFKEIKQKKTAIKNGAYRLGYLYRYGKGIEKDSVKAKHWYRKSAEAGYPDAALRLADMYYQGEFGDTNDVIAYAWLIQAKNLGYEDKVENEWNKADSILHGVLNDQELSEAIVLGAYKVKDMPH